VELTLVPSNEVTPVEEAEEVETTLFCWAPAPVEEVDEVDDEEPLEPLELPEFPELPEPD
jgi:hypothetical protein